jgi:hypothetical protein
LEKFFYSIVPIEMRSSLDTEPLKHFFLTLLQCIKFNTMQRKHDAERVYIVMPKGEKQIDWNFPAHQLVSFSLDLDEAGYVGYMLISDLKEKQQEFIQRVFGKSTC